MKNNLFFSLSNVQYDVPMRTQTTYKFTRVIRKFHVNVFNANFVMGTLLSNGGTRTYKSATLSEKELFFFSTVAKRVTQFI